MKGRRRCGRRPAPRWTTDLPLKVIPPHKIDFEALCGAIFEVLSRLVQRPLPLSDYSKVDTPASQYKLVNFREGKCMTCAVGGAGTDQPHGGPRPPVSQSVIVNNKSAILWGSWLSKTNQ